MQSPYLFTFFLKSILAKSSLQMDSGLAFTFGTFFATPLGVTKSMQRSSPAGFASSRAGPFLGNPHLRHVSLRTDSQTNPLDGEVARMLDRERVLECLPDGNIHPERVSALRHGGELLK